MAEHLLDATGLDCPLPVLEVKKALNNVPAGEVLKVLSTDPGSVADFEAFCSLSGNELLDWSQDGDVYSARIKRLA